MKRGARTYTRMLTAMTLSAGIATFMTPHLASQIAGQKTFASSKEAVEMFIQAVRSSDHTALLSILGSGSEAIISSGDEVADRAARDTFLAKYDAKHTLVPSGRNQFTLDVGTDSWPLPIPLIDNGGSWYFDGAAGKEEIVYRRIGHNELSAIDVCKGVVAAQRDYAVSSHDGKPTGTYADRVVSDPGKQNGLYWDVKSGEPLSPAGPMLASASQQGYDTSGQRTPYHGYYYHMLKDSGGYAFLAYPAQYRSSGVMTFVVTQKGIVYQKDLGTDTAEVAGHMEQFKLDSSWKPAK